MLGIREVGRSQSLQSCDAGPRTGRLWAGCLNGPGLIYQQQFTNNCEFSNHQGVPDLWLPWNRSVSVWQPFMENICSFHSWNIEKNNWWLPIKSQIGLFSFSTDQSEVHLTGTWPWKPQEWERKNCEYWLASFDSQLCPLLLTGLI